METWRRTSRQWRRLSERKMMIHEEEKEGDLQRKKVIQ
jgi:hypothetical protein